MPAKSIRIIGARQHNLKNLHVEIPREKLVVITGLRGSGKSSLAFDTLYAEGQRRYVESLSAYARQFLDQMEKPDVDFIEGLSPAIAIEQRSSGTNPRSIIATTTEIYDYLRVLFSAVGQPHDPLTGQAIFRQTAQQIVDRVKNEIGIDWESDDVDTFKAGDPSTAPQQGQLPLYDPRRLGDHRIERVVINGVGVRRLACIDGCRGAAGAPSRAPGCGSHATMHAAGAGACEMAASATRRASSFPSRLPAPSA